MSARNLVRNLRDSGALVTAPPKRSVTSTLALVLGALCFGAAMYVGATSGVPLLLDALEKKPPTLSFSKP